MTKKDYEQEPGPQDVRPRRHLEALKVRDLVWITPCWTEIKRPPVIVLEDVEYHSWSKDLLQIQNRPRKLKQLMAGRSEKKETK